MDLKREYVISAQTTNPKPVDACVCLCYDIMQTISVYLPLCGYNSNVQLVLPASLKMSRCMENKLKINNSKSRNQSFFQLNSQLLQRYYNFLILFMTKIGVSVKQNPWNVLKSLQALNL